VYLFSSIHRTKACDGISDCADDANSCFFAVDETASSVDLRLLTLIDEDDLFLLLLFADLLLSA